MSSIYTSLAGIMSNMSSQEATSNNITNLDTIGYKQDQSSYGVFGDKLMQQINGKNTNKLLLKTQVNNIKTIFKEGTFSETGNQTDLAIKGNGFFAVSDGTKTYYTKAGDFKINAEGYLVTGDQKYVQGQSGKIKVPALFSVAQDGAILDTATSVKVDTIKIVDMTSAAQVKKYGKNSFVTPEANVTTADMNTKVIQGMLESSNVDLAKEMSDVVATQRSLQLNSQVLRLADELMGKAASEIAKF